MKQSLILTGTTCKTEIPFSKIDNLTDNTNMHIFKKRGRKRFHSKLCGSDYVRKRISEKAKKSMLVERSKVSSRRLTMN